MKMLILRFFHPSQVTYSLAITSSCSGPPQRQNELLALRTCKGGGGRHTLPMYGLTTSSCCQRLPVPCLWMLLGKKGHLFCRIQEERGQEEGAVSSIPIPACCHIQLFWQEEKQRKQFLLWLMLLQVTAVWLQSCTDNCSPLDHNTGSQPLQLLSLDQI